jgi:hypothetical protein
MKPFAAQEGVGPSCTSCAAHDDDGGRLMAARGVWAHGAMDFWRMSPNPGRHLRVVLEDVEHAKILQ